MEYYPDFKKKEIKQHETTWMNTGDIMLSEINQRKTNTAWFQLCKVSEIVKFIEPISKLNILTGYTVSIQKSIVFPHTSNELENEILNILLTLHPNAQNS